MLLLSEFAQTCLSTLGSLGIEKALHIADPDPKIFQIPVLGWLIPHYLLLTIGFTGQILFSARVVLQAWASKQRGESYTPLSYWTFSLLAAFLIALYCFMRSEPVGLVMQTLMSAIYLRNIYLIYYERMGSQFPRIAARLASGCFEMVFLLFLAGSLMPNHNVVENVSNPHSFHLPILQITVPAKIIVAWGFLGSAVFMSRFFVQWLTSERAHRSIVPTSFWVMASIGSIMLLTYFIIRSEPVQMIGQMTTLPAYIYNLWLIRRKKQRDEFAANHAPATAE